MSWKNKSKAVLAVTRPFLYQPPFVPRAATSWFPWDLSQTGMLCWARHWTNVLTGAAFAGTVLLLIAAAAADGNWHVLARAVLGGIALAGFYLMLALISPSGMGMGDVKAAAGLGIMLGWRGWTALVAGGFAGFLFAPAW
jgi:prepilin signal peptidase PulO-like enzyme (type II secretory pathway)